MRDGLNIKRRPIALIALPLLLSACAVPSAHYDPPALPVAEGTAFVTQADGFDNAAPVPDDWWQLYDDPALETLVEQALAANTDLRVASANFAQAQAVLSEARAGRLPSTTATGGVNYGNGFPGGGAQGSVGNLGDTDLSVNAGIALSYQIDLFGRVGQSIRAASADAEAQQAARDAVRVTVASETTRSYLNACAYAFSVDVARQSRETATETLRLTEALQQAGSLGRLDVERAAAAAARAKAEIPGLEAQRRLALFELAALLGTTPVNVPAEALSCTAPPQPNAAIPVGDGTQLLRRRPDIRQAERELAAATARIGVTAADLYPSISLGGSGNFFRNDQVRGSDSFSFSLGPLISWSFPNISVARARVRQAEAGEEAALASFDGSVVNALKEVEQALSVVASGEEALSALAEARDRSAKAHEFAALRYRAGSVGYLDVLLAQGDLLAARSAYAAQIQQLSSARVDLFRALGGGWKEADEATPASS